MATVSQTHVRCAGCNRRLADLVNEVEVGQVLIELKCPRCGQPHLEVIRPQPTGTPPRAPTASRISMGLSLVLMILASVSPQAVSGASVEPLPDVNGKAITRGQQESGLDVAPRAHEAWICELPLPAVVDEQPPAPEAPERGVTMQALVSSQTGEKAEPVGDTETDAICLEHESTLADEPDAKPAPAAVDESAHEGKNR